MNYFGIVSKTNDLRSFFVLLKATDECFYVSIVHCVLCSTALFLGLLGDLLSGFCWTFESPGIIGNSYWEILGDSLGLSKRQILKYIGKLVRTNIHNPCYLFRSP